MPEEFEDHRTTEDETLSAIFQELAEAPLPDEDVYDRTAAWERLEARLETPEEQGSPLDESETFAVQRARIAELQRSLRQSVEERDFAGSSAENVVATKPKRPTFWSNLDVAARDRLERKGRNRRYRKGDHLCLQGGPSDQVLILKEGWAKVCVGDSDGREKVIAVRGPGELIGETGLVDGSPQPATVTALHVLTALVVPRQGFRAFLADYPDAWPRVYETLSRRLAQSNERILSLGSHASAGRLALFLLSLAEQSGAPDAEGGILLPPLSQTELGSCVDVSRETVARVMRELRRLGLIRNTWRQTVLLDPEGLRRYIRSS